MDCKQMLNIYNGFQSIDAAMKVNAEMLDLYWQLGHTIVEKQEKSDWRDKIISQLAKGLNAEFKDTINHTFVIQFT